MVLGPSGFVSYRLRGAGRWGVSGVSCNPYFAEVKHISRVGGSVFCGIGAWPVCLGDSPTPSAAAPDSACMRCDASPPAPAHDSLLLYSAPTPASRPPPTAPLTGPLRLLCLLEGEISSELEASTCEPQQRWCAPCYGHPAFASTSCWGSRVLLCCRLSSPLLQHWALTGGSLFIHNQRESAAVCYCNNRPGMSRL